MVLVVGHPAPGATVPVHATIKKPLEQIASWL
jgi:iodotyrosine deiodinase